MCSGWPALSYTQWHATCDTLHAHTQVLGKLAARLAPPEPQLQHAALRLTARGWETAPLPAPDGSWPGDGRYGGPAFYAYAHPAPDTFAGGTLEPAAARWEADLGEYVLDWSEIAAEADPRAAAVEF